MTAALLSLASTWFRNGHVNQVRPILCERESSGDLAKVSHSKKESESEMFSFLLLMMVYLNVVPGHHLAGKELA